MTNNEHNNTPNYPDFDPLVVYLAQIEQNDSRALDLNPAQTCTVKSLLEKAGFLGRDQSETSIHKGIDDARWLIEMGESRQSLSEMPFVEMGNTNRSEGTANYQVNFSGTELPQINPDIITSADSFDSWLGRGKKGTGETAHGASIDKIELFASKETAIPPAELALVINADGSFNVIAKNSHRVAAAKLRGENVTCAHMQIIDHREPSRKFYETGSNSEQDWNTIQERVDQLSIPLSPEDRANDIADNFSSTSDLKNLTHAVHQVLVPDYMSVETSFAMSVEGADGKKKMVQPSERTKVFDEASAQIRRLAIEMKKTGEYEAFLERVGTIVGFAIVMAHPFAEGNGRTARFVGDLIMNGPESSNLEIGGSPRAEPGSPGVRLNSYVPKKGMGYRSVLYAASGGNTLLTDRDAYKNSASGAISSTPYW